jgi:hypothetical protein
MNFERTTSVVDSHDHQVAIKLSNEVVEELLVVQARSSVEGSDCDFNTAEVFTWPQLTLQAGVHPWKTEVNLGRVSQDPASLILLSSVCVLTWDIAHDVPCN